MLDRIEDMLAKHSAVLSYEVIEDRDGALLGVRVIVDIAGKKPLRRASEGAWWSGYVATLRADVLARLEARAARRDNVFVVVREDGRLELYITAGIE